MGYRESESPCNFFHFKPWVEFGLFFLTCLKFNHTNSWLVLFLKILLNVESKHVTYFAIRQTFSKTLQKVRCHHGKLNKQSDVCDCDVGWESENDIDLGDFIPSTIPLHMCTVRVQRPTERFVDKLKDAIGLEEWTTLVPFVSLHIRYLFN